MKEKQFDPARQNTDSPAPGLASVNTHNPDEEQVANDLDIQRMKAGQQEKESIDEETKGGDSLREE
jgi:hypothetical protein